MYTRFEKFQLDFVDIFMAPKIFFQNCPSSTSCFKCYIYKTTWGKPDFFIILANNYTQN